METSILSWWEQFKLNCSYLYLRARVWVLAMWGIGLAYWQSGMTDVEHQAFYDIMPFGLGKWAPILVFFVTYIAANGWPQPALKAKLEDKKDRVVTAKLDKLDAERQAGA